jgi:hypothetical protein
MSFSTDCSVDTPCSPRKKVKSSHTNNPVAMMSSPKGNVNSGEKPSTPHLPDDQDIGSYDKFFEESSLEKLSLPSQGQVELRDFHKRASALGKLLTYQQTLQLGMSAVKVCFDKAIPGHYTNDHKFMEQLFCVIFFQCGDRRMMLEGKKSD